MRAVVTYQYCSDSYPESNAICHMWVDFVLVLFLTPRGLSLSAPVLTLPHPEKEIQKVSSYKFCGPTNHIYIFSPFPVSKVNYSRESGEDVTSPKHGKVRFGVRQKRLQEQDFLNTK